MMRGMGIVITRVNVQTAMKVRVGALEK